MIPDGFVNSPPQAAKQVNMFAEATLQSFKKVKNVFQCYFYLLFFNALNTLHCYQVLETLANLLLVIVMRDRDCMFISFSIYSSTS